MVLVSGVHGVIFLFLLLTTMSITPAYLTFMHLQQPLLVMGTLVQKQRQVEPSPSFLSPLPLAPWEHFLERLLMR